MNIELSLEFYYSTNQVKYAIRYSETNLMQANTFYTELTNHWFLWIAPMT